MISPETHVEVRRLFYAEHWKIGTIASKLGIHPDAVRHALEFDRLPRSRPLRPSLTDPYREFLRQTLEQYPRLRATRLYHMIRERGYTGSVVQSRRAVASLRPPTREAFLRPVRLLISLEISIGAVLAGFVIFKAALGYGHHGIGVPRIEPRYPDCPSTTRTSQLAAHIIKKREPSEARLAGCAPNLGWCAPGSYESGSSSSCQRREP